MSDPLQYRLIPYKNNFYELECSRVKGDCMFACMAIWLNLAINSKSYLADDVRKLAAAQITESNLNGILMDISLDADGPALNIETVKDLKRAIKLPSEIWGSHSTMLLSLSAFSQITKKNIGAIIVTEHHDDSQLIQIDDNIEPDFCIILSYSGNVHYRLIGASDLPHPRVVFDMKNSEYLQNIY